MVGKERDGKVSPDSAHVTRRGNVRPVSHDVCDLLCEGGLSRAGSRAENTLLDLQTSEDLLER